MSAKEFDLFSNFISYIDIIDDKDEKFTNTIENLSNLIKKYYEFRIDMESEYFDPYAYVNELNPTDENIKNMELIYNFKNYIKEIIDVSNTETDSIASVYKILKYYYIERIDVESPYFDEYVFMNDLNDDIALSDYSDDDDDDNTSCSSNDENSDSEKNRTDPYIDQFLNNINNDDILLYQKHKINYQDNVLNFIENNFIF